MSPDYDLSNLHADQADLWMCLQIDGILAGILADQPERRKSPLALGAAQHCGPHCGAAVGFQQHITGGRPFGVGLESNEVN